MDTDEFSSSDVLVYLKGAIRMGGTGKSLFSLFQNSEIKVTLISEFWKEKKKDVSTFPPSGPNLLL